MGNVYVKTTTTNAGMSETKAAELLFPSAMGLSFLRGAIFGAALIAAMDYGDVWLCVGACNAQPNSNVMEDE